MSDSIIDVNVNLSRWPTRRIREDEIDVLTARLAAQGVVEAWAGSLDGLLHKDIEGVNSRLTEQCSRPWPVKLRPFGTINPMLPDWEEDLRRCAMQHKMPGIRLHPNYHGYKLDDPLFARVLRVASEHRLVITLTVQMEDERMMHPLLRVRPVVLDPLLDLLPQTPSARLVILNAGRALVADKIRKLASAGQVYFDIAVLDGMGVIDDIVQDVPTDRILFGSHSPLFYFESALLKLQESGIPKQLLESIHSANARRLLS